MRRLCGREAPPPERNRFPARRDPLESGPIYLARYRFRAMGTKSATDGRKARRAHNRARRFNGRLSVRAIRPPFLISRQATRPRLLRSNYAGRGAAWARGGTDAAERGGMGEGSEVGVFGRGVVEDGLGGFKWGGWWRFGGVG